jgi:hypothetical protein
MVSGWVAKLCFCDSFFLDMLFLKSIVEGTIISDKVCKSLQPVVGVSEWGYNT